MAVMPGPAWRGADADEATVARVPMGTRAVRESASTVCQHCYTDAGRREKGEGGTRRRQRRLRPGPRAGVPCVGVFLVGPPPRRCRSSGGRPAWKAAPRPSGPRGAGWGRLWGVSSPGIPSRLSACAGAPSPTDGAAAAAPPGIAPRRETEERCFRVICFSTKHHTSKHPPPPTPRPPSPPPPCPRQGQKNAEQHATQSCPP